MEFNLKRLGLLLNRDMKELLLKTIGIIGLIFFTIVTINLVISFFAANPRSHDFNIYGTFLAMFFISCSIIGSLTWEEINKRPSRIEYLALPASTTEKLSSKFITVAIFFPILMVILYFIMRGYASLFNTFNSGKLGLDNISDTSQFNLFIVGSIITAVFAYGSIKFNTGSYPKIIIWALAFVAAFVAISFVIGFITFPELRNLVFGRDIPNNVVQTNENIEEFWALQLVKKLFYIVPLIFWGMAFFTLKEKEA